MTAPAVHPASGDSSFSYWDRIVIAAGRMDGWGRHCDRGLSAVTFFLSAALYLRLCLWMSGRMRVPVARNESGSVDPLDVDVWRRHGGGIRLPVATLVLNRMF